MPLSSPLTRLRHAIAQRGMFVFIITVPRIIYRRVFPKKLSAHPFDLLHGVDTSGILYERHLPSNHKNAGHANAYWGTHPSLFAKVISRWMDTIPVTAESYHFIDVGCGKGRVLLMASELPFASVTGIDLYPHLTGVALQNIQHWLKKPRACSNIYVITGDALLLKLPDGPVVIYMYHPFGIEVMEPFMAKLRMLASVRRHPIDILYVNPALMDKVGFNTGLIKLLIDEHHFTAEEFAVDAFQDPRHWYAIFRVATSDDSSNTTG